jgi:peptide deformylase
MTVLPILHWPDPRLSAPCAPVAPGEDVARLASDMLDTMYAAPGRGLAAPQVGVMKRLFVMDVAWKTGPPDPQVCLNPEILSRSDTRAIASEGCLSIPGLLAPVERPTAIRLRWTALDGTAQEADLEGFSALCAQHETDHLDGILTLDHLLPEARAALLAGRGA